MIASHWKDLWGLCERGGHVQECRKTSFLYPLYPLLPCTLTTVLRGTDFSASFSVWENWDSKREMTCPQPSSFVVKTRPKVKLLFPKLPSSFSPISPTCHSQETFSQDTLVPALLTAPMFHVFFHTLHASVSHSSGTNSVPSARGRGLGESGGRAPRVSHYLKLPKSRSVEK